MTLIDKTLLFVRMQAMKEPGEDFIHKAVDAAVKRVWERPREQAALLGTLKQTHQELFASGCVPESERGTDWPARRETAATAASALLDHIEDTLPQLYDDEDRQAYLHNTARFLAIPLGRFEEARAFALRLDSHDDRRNLLSQLIYRTGHLGQLEVAECCLNNLAPKDRPRGLLTLATTQRPPVEPGAMPDLANEAVAAAIGRTDALLKRTLTSLTETQDLNPRDRAWILINSAQLYRMIGRPKEGAPLLGQALAAIVLSRDVDDEFQAIAGCARESGLFLLSVRAAQWCQSPTTRSYNLARACELLPQDFAQLSADEREWLLTLIKTSAANISDLSVRERQYEMLTQIRASVEAAGETIPLEEIVEEAEGE